jgi:hypothetical protein
MIPAGTVTVIIAVEGSLVEEVNAIRILVRLNTVLSLRVIEKLDREAGEYRPKVGVWERSPNSIAKSELVFISNL